MTGVSKLNMDRKKIPASRGLQAYASASGTPEGYRNSKTAYGLPGEEMSQICPTDGQKGKK